MLKCDAGGFFSPPAELDRGEGISKIAFCEYSQNSGWVCLSVDHRDVAARCWLLVTFHGGLGSEKPESVATC